MKIKERKNKISLIMYLLVFYLIMGSDTVLLGYTENEMIKTLAQFFMVAMAFLAFCYYIRQNGLTFKSDVVWLLFAFAWIILGGLLHNELRGGTVSIIALFILGYSICRSCNMHDFIEAFLKLMTIIAFVSVIGFAFASLIVKIGFIPSVYNSVGKEFKFLLFTNVPIEGFTRNYGPFTEPSRFQAYLNLTLILLLFTDNKISYKRVIIVLLALVTTFSTTGYLVIVVTLIAFIFSKKVKMKMGTKALLAFPLIVGCVVLFYTNDIFSNAINKLLKGGEDVSASTRYDSIKINLLIFKDNFFFGAGFSGSEEAFASIMSKYGFNAQTNTITPLIYFSKFGVVVGLYYIFNLFTAAKHLSNSKSYGIIFLALLLMVSGISFLDSIFFNVILFYRRPRVYSSMPIKNELLDSENIENLNGAEE